MHTTTPRTEPEAATPAARRRARLGVVLGVAVVVAAAVIGIWLTLRDSGSSEVATVHAAVDAWNANDADAYASHWAEGAQGFGLFGAAGAPVGSPEMELAIANLQASGGQITVSDCELNNRTVRCVQTNDDPRWGIVVTMEFEFTFNDEGQITGLEGSNFPVDEVNAFRTALGNWMATAHPEVFETYFVTGAYLPKEENWRNPEAIAELSQLIDEFIAQSDVYPLSP